MKIAIPTMGAGGLDCERSGHFGHCDCFTVVTVEDGKIVATDIIDNPPHEEGGCLRPVGILANAGIDAIVAAGMGITADDIDELLAYGLTYDEIEDYIYCGEEV